MKTLECSLQEAVVGGVLYDPSWLNEVLQLGDNADLFTEPESVSVWRVIMELHSEGFAPDAVLVNERIKRDKVSVPAATLSRMLLGSAPTSMSLADYVRDLMAQANARKRESLWADGSQARKAENAEGEQETAEMIGRTFAQPEPVQTIQGAAAEFAAEIERGVVPDLGIPTGLIDIDRSLGTLQPAELVLVAARTSVGKSSFVRQVGMRAAFDGRPVVFVSTEMGAREIAIASARQQTGIPWRKGEELPGPESKAFAEMVRRISVLSTFKLVAPQTLSAMIARFETMMEADFAPRLFVVDYIQQIDSEKEKGETLASAIGRISRALKEFALKHSVVVLAAAQLNREAVKDEEPQPHHLRDSGSLEQDADRVLMMKLETEDEATRFATVRMFQRKHRNGAQGSVRLNFDRWTTRFANYAA
jgi:replicative DNA helicase